MRVKNAGKLKRARERAGYTQVDLAHLVGVTQQYISALEKGAAKSPTERVAKKLARYLGIELEDYFDVIELSSLPAVTTSSRVTSRQAS